MTTERHIVAVGGMTSAKAQDNVPLLSYILKQARTERPRVLITGPGHDETAQGYKYFTFFSELDCRMSHLSLFRLPTADLEDWVLQHDVVWVGGGNTKAMLALWQEFGLDKVLRKAWKAGIVLSGVSAGALCWFTQGLSDSFPGTLTLLKCKFPKLLPHSCVVHYRGNPLSVGALRETMKSGQMKPGYAIEDNVALHFVGTELNRAVALKKGSSAYKTGRSKGKVQLVRLTPTVLGPHGEITETRRRRT